MKNTDFYGENHHLKVDNIRLKSENKKLKLNNKALKQQLSLNSVSHRRELLIAFFDSVDAEDMEQQRNSKGWKVVDRYLKAIDCC